jgi:5-hydroxyisourate hydrolase-like protein (transthyretin family)
MNDLEPSEFYLSQNYPNPFSEKTTIKFCVAYKSKVKLEIINPEGEMIKILLDEEKEAGTYEVEFIPSDCNSGESLSADKAGRNLTEGIYVYQLHAGDFLAAKKMNLLGSQYQGPHPNPST